MYKEKLHKLKKKKHNREIRETPKKGLSLCSKKKFRRFFTINSYESL